jgi:hypothetical protein
VKIEAIQHGKDKWIIGRNPTMVSNPDSGSGQSRTAFDGYWAHDKWESTKDIAMEFDSAADATAYIDQNRQRMESF